MRRASVQWIGSCSAGIWMWAGVAGAGPLDPGTSVCLHPADLPIENAATDPRTADVQTRLVAALRGAGFAVREPDAVDALVHRLIEKADDAVFDPYTGKRDPQRYQARLAAISQAFRTELDCQVRMIAEVRPVYAHFRNGLAQWDRKIEAVSSEGRQVMNALGGVQEWGFVPALTLWIRVLDLEGEEIAFRSAGIETLVSFAVVKERDALPEDRWLRNGEKIDAAIRLAIGPEGSDLRLQGNPHWQEPPS